MDIGQLYRQESGRVLATLIRLLGDFAVAEEVVQEAFTAAVEQWGTDGVPERPAAWLLRTARNKAIDRIRRRRLAGEKERLLAAQPADIDEAASEDPPDLVDDRLRLIFTCCHPALALEVQVALTLHTLCGLRTCEIARAFLVPAPAMAQRLVRAKAKIRDARIPYQVPPPESLPERLDGVMAAVYLVFNEGYAATTGDSIVRRELCAEAIRLGRLLCELLPSPLEPEGLLALMLLHDARAAARSGPAGELVLLEDQDRTRWDPARIAEGARRVEAALRRCGGRPGGYTLQAAIAALHCQAAQAADTDWPQIVALYALLRRVQPTPIVALNHAVARAMAEGPAVALPLLDELAATGELRGYHLLPAARGDLLRRLGRHAEAAVAFRVALGLVRNAAERDFLLRRLAEAEAAG